MKIVMPIHAVVFVCNYDCDRTCHCSLDSLHFPLLFLRLSVSTEHPTQVVPLPQDLLLDHVDKKTLPTSVDWRRRSSTSGSSVGVVTPVKNQGRCGSCWAFAATAALESHIALATGKLFVFSVQEFVSCVPNIRHCGGGGGCSGSTAELAYDFVATHGMVTEWDFGYQSYHGAQVNCTLDDDNDNNNGNYTPFLTVESPSEHILRRRLPQGSDQDKNHKLQTTAKDAVASIVGFALIPKNSYDTMLKAVATLGPVVVNVAAHSWGTYSDGIFNDDNEPTRDVNHAVVLEGYGTDEVTGQDYWLIRNSWGPLWGTYEHANDYICENLGGRHAPGFLVSLQARAVCVHSLLQF
jgi:cathepsin L